MAGVNWYKKDKILHLDLMRFSKQYGLKGKCMAELEKIRGDIVSGRLQLKPIQKGKNPDSIAKRKVDTKLGIRYLVKEVVMNMPHVMECAYAKSSDNYFVEYLYCATDLRKQEISQLLGFPVTTLNKKIDRFNWKKKTPITRIQSVGMLIEVIYKDPGDAIVVPAPEEIKDVDERYRQEFYKISVRIKQALNKSVPDATYIDALTRGATGLSKVHHMERELNGILCAKDEREVTVKEEMLKLNKDKFDGGYGDITVVEMTENYDRDIHALMFLLKETMGEKGLSVENSDAILTSLVHKLKKVNIDDEE